MLYKLNIYRVDTEQVNLMEHCEDFFCPCFTLKILVYTVSFIMTKGEGGGWGWKAVSRQPRPPLRAFSMIS